jgi:hypothetical protein
MIFRFKSDLNKGTFQYSYNILTTTTHAKYFDLEQHAYQSQLHLNRTARPPIMPATNKTNSLRTEKRIKSIDQLELAQPPPLTRILYCPHIIPQPL